MRTVAETRVFQRYAADIWTDAELSEFISWIAKNPTAGDLIAGSGGCRKVRWSIRAMPNAAAHAWQSRMAKIISDAPTG